MICENCGELIEPPGEIVVLEGTPRSIWAVLLIVFGLGLMLGIVFS